MSADARRPGRACGQTARPETVTEKSFMESVTGIINEVVPSSYSHQSSGADHRETVQWARFEHCDVNDICSYTEQMEANGNVAPLVLVIGYTTGVQVWLLQGNGEAHEVLSWRQGVARDARLLPSPETGMDDLYVQKRPLMAVCDAAGSETQFCSVGLISLRTGEQVKSVKFKSAISAVLATHRVMVVTFPGKLAVFDAGTLEDRFTVTTCYPAPGVLDNPVALGHRWLAYGEKRLTGYLQSRGGMNAESSHSYTASMLHAAKSISKGIRELGEGLASTLAGGRYAPPVSPAAGAAASSNGAPQPGLVTVLDVLATGRGGPNAPPGHGVVAHFQAHLSAVVQLCFDASGTLLLTADKPGNSFHVFRIQPHSQRPALATVHHLYTLYRGDTTAKVLDLSFSLDSRWVSVATHRGTTHVFPICPYGGAISTRTHCGPRVVNKLSRFHRSAGLQDSTCHGSGRNSPLSPRTREASGGGSPGGGPAPVLVPPMAQLRQPLLTQLTAGSGPSPRHSPTARHVPTDDTSHVRVVCTFAPSRGWVAGSAGGGGGGSAGSRERRHWDALYVMSSGGSLIEYHVEPRPAGVIAKDRVPEDAPVEVTVHAHAQWSLCRQTVWPEVRPPLATGSVLLHTPTPPAPPTPPAGAEQWVSQVEILSHSGPHRRLWMGPQFSFRPFSDSAGGASEGRDLLSAARSSPVNMPAQLASHSIECGSANSYEQSPRLIDALDTDSDRHESQLCQRIAEAMSDLGPPAVLDDCSRRRRRRRSDSARSSASSSSVDVRLSPERGGSPLDFSEYERDAPPPPLQPHLLDEPLPPPPSGVPREEDEEPDSPPPPAEDWPEPAPPRRRPPPPLPPRPRDPSPPPLSDGEDSPAAHEFHTARSSDDDSSPPPPAPRPLERQPSCGFEGGEQVYDREREQESGWGDDILCPDLAADSSSRSASDRERADKTSDEERPTVTVTKRKGKKKRR
ncbi:breast carcinoma-amplified sequence 3 homolog [Amphibalanus amphitrite]|uniref:breast carcinoma-amplified sequence 3 homolog n=1 Tax=Amphibalanus amphitrite TaxID=1232801 RepID=UPI001C8FA8F4|nr:breast carcinoma-amplified sequence 3 homolog [Amphibalanus amphitrite]XP_043196974.1 breast carcinoma-amplified sequence 3 homolog [Amphibalanus amphitrite]